MRKLRFLFVAAAALSIAGVSNAQQPQRTSPKAEVGGKVGGARVDIVYCRPSADNR
jgi:hypothetical protein